MIDVVSGEALDVNDITLSAARYTSRVDLLNNLRIISAFVVQDAFEEGLQLSDVSRGHLTILNLLLLFNLLLHLEQAVNTVLLAAQDSLVAFQLSILLHALNVH